MRPDTLSLLLHISSGVGRGSMSCGGPETITNYYYAHNVITLVRRNPKHTSISFYVPVVSGPCRLCNSFLCACGSSMFPQAMAEDLSQSQSRNLAFYPFELLAMEPLAADPKLLPSTIVNLMSYY